MSHHARLGLLLLLACGAAGCAAATRPPPWDVRANQQESFRETRKLCHELTDGKDGGFQRELFETCMARRGFQRQSLLRRAWVGLTGG